MRIPTRQEFEAGRPVDAKVTQAIDVTVLSELVGRIERLATENGELRYALDKAEEKLASPAAPKPVGFGAVVHSHPVGRYMHADTVANELERAIQYIHAYARNSEEDGTLPPSLYNAREALRALLAKCKA